MKTKLFLSLSLLTAVFTGQVSSNCEGNGEPFQNISRLKELKNKAHQFAAHARIPLTSNSAKLGAMGALGTAGAVYAIGSVGEYVKAQDIAEANGLVAVQNAKNIAAQNAKNIADQNTAAESKRLADLATAQKALANRSYFQMFKDGSSHYATALGTQAFNLGTKIAYAANNVKENTWDTNNGFNHSGKVATVATLAAVVGLSYLAYKNYVGKAAQKQAPVAKKAPVAPAKKRILPRI